MSNYIKRVVCLATSKKDRERCVAGKSMSAEDRGQWIRPVSNRPTAEISLDERRYENGQEPELLDIIDIPMLAPMPRGHQTENHLIDADEYWVKRGTATWNDLCTMVDTPLTVWGQGSSTGVGSFDRLTPAMAVEIRNSLLLIHPEHVTMRVLTPGVAFGNPKRRVRASFRYGGINYDFMVTDLAVEQRFLAKANGVYLITQETYFCVSLAEAYTDDNGNTYCYKLVAGVFSEQPLG